MENELETEEEYQAWDTLMASMGQFKISPTGHVLGLDFQICFEIAKARQYDLKTVSEILQDAEPVIVSKINERNES